MHHGRRFGRSTVAPLWTVVWALACGGGPEPVATTATTPPIDQGPIGPVAVDRRPTPDLMRRLASGEEPLARYVEADLGVSFLEYREDASGEDARAGEDGVIRVAERLCGDDLSARLQHVRDELARRVADAGDDPLFNCTETRCFYRARAEYDFEGRFEFRDDPDRGLVLERVVNIEGGSLTEELAEQADAWIEQEVVRLAEEGCAAEAAPSVAPPAGPTSSETTAGD